MAPMTLTKSRFTMAMECPRKLDYARDPNYYDARVDDEFLASLAEGGHQVGELARRMHPGGPDRDRYPTDLYVYGKENGSLCLGFAIRGGEDSQGVKQIKSSKMLDRARCGTTTRSCALVIFGEVL